MIKIKQYFLLLAVCFAFLTAGVCLAATLELEPATGTFDIGDVFEVKVILNAEGESTDGVDLTYFNYPKDILEVQDSDINAEGIQVSPGSLYANTMTNKVLADEGKIRFAQITSAGLHFSGSGVLTTVTFKAIADGRAGLYFDAEAGSTRDSNVSGSGQDLLVSASGAIFEIGDVSDIPMDESEDEPEGESEKEPADEPADEGSGEQQLESVSFFYSRTALFVLIGLLVVLLIILIVLKKKQNI